MIRDFSLDSGERITALNPDDVDLAHTARYRFAVGYLAAKDYHFGLDLFCGSGYGTLMLAEKLPAVVLGIDGSSEAVTEAAKRVGLANAFFAHKVFPFSLPGQWADFVVSFETITNLEHFEGFARLMAHTLKPGGTLILSAPNEDRLPLDENRFEWQNCLPIATGQILWHWRHFRPQDMAALFESHGLISRQTLSSHSYVNKNGRAICRNDFSPAENMLKLGASDDDVIYIFEKRPA